MICHILMILKMICCLWSKAGCELAGCQLLCGHGPFSWYFPEVSWKAVKERRDLSRDNTLLGSSSYAAGAQQVPMPAYPSVTFSFAQILWEQRGAVAPGPRAEQGL